MRVNDGYIGSVSTPSRADVIYIDERGKTLVSQRRTNRDSLGGGGQGRSADWKILDVKGGML